MLILHRSQAPLKGINKFLFTPRYTNGQISTSCANGFTRNCYIYRSVHKGITDI